MKRLFFLFLSVCTCASLQGAPATCKLENAYLLREFSIEPALQTSRIVNKRTGFVQSPFACDEFRLRLSRGPQTVGTDFLLTSKDFLVRDVSDYALTDGVPGKGLLFTLTNADHALTVEVCYELRDSEPYMRKELRILGGDSLTLERLDVEALALEGSYQPYTKKTITTRVSANWSPGLGQPLYNYLSATFWGVEFPAATNVATEQEMLLGYLCGRPLGDTAYRSYRSVMGVADDADFLQETFFDYIDAIRVRPLHLQVQYNSWFDFRRDVNGENFAQSTRKVHDELVVKRGVPPLDAYVIDDGWQDVSLPHLSEPDGVWSINGKFSGDFVAEHALTRELDSRLGLWLSPGSLLGGRPQIKILRDNGYEALDGAMSLTGPGYMDKLEARILGLTRQGVGFFKFDGLFGQLLVRDFELRGRGTPSMPQLNIDKFSTNDIRLGDPKYDELKTYYLVAGTERLMRIMQRQHEIDPQVFIAITNGAYLSPWWLQYADVVWLINSGDSAGKNGRTEELVYRDGVYYEVFRTENTQFPLNAIFNHEPKKTSTGESPETFRRYLYMNLSRGTCFVELYLKTRQLSESDWDVLAEGLKWAHATAPAFRRVRMFGGDPRQRQVYGYSGWCDTSGYVALHNPSDRPQSFRLALNRHIGMPDGRFTVTSPLPGGTEKLKSVWGRGDVLELELPAGEVAVLNFRRDAQNMR